MAGESGVCRLSRVAVTPPLARFPRFWGHGAGLMITLGTQRCRRSRIDAVVVDSAQRAPLSRQHDCCLYGLPATLSRAFGVVLAWARNRPPCFASAVSISAIGNVFDTRSDRYPVGRRGAGAPRRPTGMWKPRPPTELELRLPFAVVAGRRSPRRSSKDPGRRSGGSAMAWQAVAWQAVAR